MNVLRHITLHVERIAACKDEGCLLTTDYGKYGYANKSGKLVIEPQYDKADMFAEGLAAVKIDEKYGFIDKNGESVIEPIFWYAQHFSEGLAAVKPF